MSRKSICLLAMLAALVLFQSAYGWMMYSAEQPNDGILGNSFIDLEYHDGILWVASGHGLSASANPNDPDAAWVTYNSSSGLNATEPSALFGQGERLWVATSHTLMYNGVNYPIGDGFNLSTNNDIFNIVWDTIIPPDSEATYFAQLVYDMAGTDSSVFAAGFHGGLIASHDFGATWSHLFYSAEDSSDWVADHWADLETGRYYSCAVDTSHADTFVVMAGSAIGIHKFLYLPKRVKLGGKKIFDIVYQDSTVYLATEGGVSRVNDPASDSISIVYFTADTTNGLGSNLVKRMAVFGDKIWAAAFDPTNRNGMGLFYSSDSAESWDEVPVDFFKGDSSGIYDFNTDYDSVIYVAAGDSGVFRSDDWGQTWVRFYIDSSDTDQASPRNQVYALDLAVDTTGATSDTIYLATRGGLVKAPIVNEPFVIDTLNDTLITFEETDSTGSFVSMVRHFQGILVSVDTVDTIYRSHTWVGVEPLTENGQYATMIIDFDSLGDHRVMFGGSKVFDIWTGGSITFLATGLGFYANPNNGERNSTIRADVIDPMTLRTLGSFGHLSIEVVNDRLYTGSTGGYGFQIGTNNWRIYLANTDPHLDDLAVSQRFDNRGLPGDWVVALEMQYYNGQATTWAACRRVGNFNDQQNAVGISADFGDSWETVLPGIRVWNFAFDSNGVAYAAASEGLYYSSPPWDEWARADLIDPVTGDTIVDGTEIFSAAVVDDSILWVGTSLGLAMRNIYDSTQWSEDDWEIERTFKETFSAAEVYAAPVPFSPINFNGRLSLHYHVEETAEITIEIYDFAMNLVKRVTDGKTRAGGADYWETWDGYNEEGDMVATGIYHFKVTYSTGDKRWGRLAIIP